MACKIFFLLVLLIVAVVGQDTCEDTYLDPAGFVKLGTYKGTTKCGHAFGKTYYISQHFKSQWINTRSICQSYGMDSLSLETLEEHNSFLQTCEKNLILFEDWTHVGATTTVGKSTDKWYWVSTGKLITYPLKWALYQPDFAGSNEYCLLIVKSPNNFSFGDIICQGAYDLKFICQKSDN